MMGKRGKRGKFLTAVTPHSSGHLAAPEVPKITIFDLNPIFSFQYVEPRYCITKCDKRDMAAFAKTLIKLGKLTWGQIFNAGRKSVGFEKMPLGQIKPNIPKSITEDVTFIVFRYSGQKPMIGFRKNEVFCPVWFESNFGDVYKH